MSAGRRWVKPAVVGLSGARRWIKPAVVVVLVVAGVIMMNDRLPDPSAVLSVMRDAGPGWLLLALAAQLGSQAAFAAQQQMLLSGFDVRLSMRDMLAITWSGSAISMVLPAGAAVSAAFTLQQYRRRGATLATAAAVMALSAVVSIGGLLLLYLGMSVNVGWIAAGAALTWWVVRGPVGRWAAATASGWWATARSAAISASGPAPTSRSAGPSTGQGFFAWLARSRLGTWLRPARRLIRQLRGVHRGKALASLGFSALKWVGDLVCLILVTRACGLPVDWHALAMIYLAVQVVRQIPLTPGGIGLIEAALLTGLVAAGAPEAPAAAAVIAYRIVSFWLVLPVGLVAYLRLPGAGPISARRVGKAGVSAQAGGRERV